MNISDKDKEYIVESIQYNIKRYKEVLDVMQDNNIVEGKDIILSKMLRLDMIIDKISNGEF